MYSGIELWKTIIPYEMEEINLSSGKTIFSCPGLPGNLYEALEITAGSFPNKPAVIDNYDRICTYSDLLQKVNVFADYLHHELHIKKGSHVALMMYNCLEFCVSFFSLLKLGAVTIPLPSKYKENEVSSLIEKAETALDEKKAEQLEKKLRENRIDLNDMLMQFEEMKKMGPMKDIISLIPGLNKKVKDTDVDDKQIDYTMAIIRSMTMKERENPDIINPSRKRRIAAGCGMQVEDVNRLLNQYRSMQKLYKQLNGKNSKKMMKRMQRMGMGGGMPGGMGGMGGFPM